MSGYSGTPLVRKLGMRAGMRVRLLGQPLGVTDASRNASDGPADFS